MKPIDPRAKRTRILLQQALGDLLKERSLASVTVADIASRATVNRATFYAHFQDKDDLLVSCLREKCRTVICQALPEQLPLSPAAWQHLIQTILEFFLQMPSQCPQAARQWNDIVVNAMREELEEALEIRLSTAISGAIVAYGLLWLRGKSTLTTEVGAAELTQFILAGMGK